MKSLRLLALCLCASVALSAQRIPGVGRFVNPSASQDAENPIAAARLPSGSQTLPESIWSAAGASSINDSRTLCYEDTGGLDSAATINTQIAGCASGTYVLLQAGSYSFSTGIDMKSNVTLRGAGPNATLITLASGSCGAYGAGICFAGDPGNYPNTPRFTSNWTAGYTKGTGVITLASAANLSVGYVVRLDETNDAVTPDLFPEVQRCMGTSNGSNLTCHVNNGVDDAGEGGGTRTGRLHTQEVVVMAIDGNDVTISPVLVDAFSSGKTPQATWGNATGTGIGVEDLSIDLQAGPLYAFEMLNVTDSWIKHVRSINPARSHALMAYAVNNTIRDSYLFRTGSHATTSYGLELQGATANLIENNILHWITAGVVPQGGAANVVAFNFGINHEYSDAPQFMFFGLTPHAGGNELFLYEGNSVTGIQSDIQHGPQNRSTAFRNYFWGRELPGTVTDSTNAAQINALNWHMNFLGNVLGTSGYHTQYQCDPDTCTSEHLSVWWVGLGYGSLANGPPNDDHTVDSLFRWGNWDVVTSTDEATSGDQTGTRWNSAEVPSAIGGSYEQSVPSSQTLPNSLYLSAKPAFFTSSDPWPFYGPDVTHASPIANTGGHAAYNPAEQCYRDVMGGTGTGTTVLAFTCTYPRP